MRGEDEMVGVREREALRITPACAGKTGGYGVGECSFQDHPRMRGEDRAVDHLGVCGEGSPPHARGRLDEDKITQEVRRITPACAGKTPTPTNPTQPSPDHPRMRGEDQKC